MNTNVRFYLSHNCRKDRNIHFKLEKSLLGSHEEVWSSDVTSVTSQWMTSHLLVALLLVTWLQSFVSETGNQFLPYPIICIYSREPVVIALVQYFIFIEWVLLHSQTLCYVINRGSNMSGHSILNLLNELVKLILCEALPSTISVLPTSLINSVLNEHEC